MLYSCSWKPRKFSNVHKNSMVVLASYGVGCFVYFVYMGFPRTSENKIKHAVPRFLFLGLAFRELVANINKSIMARQCCLVALFSLYTLLCMAQETSKGYIINIEGDKIYLDFTSSSVRIGDELAVLTSAGYFTHPVTGQKIPRSQEQVATVRITEVYDTYSVAKVEPSQMINKIKVGMPVSKQIQVEPDNNDGVIDVAASHNVVTQQQKENISHLNQSTTMSSERVSVVVAPAQVNDVVGVGYFGSYVADILMEQLMQCDKVKLLDRTILNAQIDETNLTGEYIDPNTAIQKGRISGAQYIIQVTMQKPDVVNIKTGIPLAAVMGAIQGITRTNIGAQYASNAQVGTLKASVNITTRVVDLQTGEVLFMCSGTGKSQGKSQLSMEYGALGGAQLNGGADGFKQTVTGKAIQKAFITIGRSLNNYFDGNTDKKVMGSASGFGNYGQQMRARGLRLYLGTEKLDKDGVQMTFTENPNLFFKYKKAKRWSSAGWGIMVGCVGLGGWLTFAGMEDGEDDTSAVGGTIIGIGVLSGVSMQILSRKKIKR